MNRRNPRWVEEEIKINERGKQSLKQEQDHGITPTTIEKSWLQHTKVQKIKRKNRKIFLSLLW